MANILVSVTEANVNVTTTLSNVTITDYESNSIIGNVITTSSNVNVTTPVTNVIVTGGVEISNIDVRAAFSNVSPILYDQVNGIFSFDSNASFASKTTDDLLEGNVNLYFTNARVDARVPTSIVNGNITLKQYNETIFNAGNIQGNATFNITNGTIQRATLTGNLTNITFTNAAPGTTLTLVLTQDAIGNWTTPTTSVLTNWEFAGNIQTINNAPLSTTYLTAVVENSGVKASIVKFTNANLAVNLSNNTTDDLAEGTVNLYFTTARARQSISGTGDISYNANTGVISYTGTPGDITSVTAGNGLTGGGSSGDVTLNVGAGTGITVNADNIAVNMGAFTTTNLAEGTNLYYTTTRANTAIDTRVNKAFVEGLGVSYTSLTDKPIIPTHTSNLVNDSGFITTATANVVSVNGETGVVVLDTGDIAEGTNLYFTAARANSNVVAHIGTVPLTVGGNLTVNGNINATGNINVQNVEDLYVRDQTIVMNANAASPANVQIVSNRPGFANTEIKWNEQSDRWTFTNDGTTYYNLATSTTDIAEGANLYYTTNRANTAIGAYQGNISTPGNITAGNVITTNIHTNGGTSLVLNANTSVVVRETIKGVSTNVGNITGDGYGFFFGAGLTGQTLVVNSSAGNLDAYFFTTGNATAGSNVITGASIALISAGAPSTSANLNLVTPYYTVSPFGQAVQDPFPTGTYVTAVDAANSTITLNNPAAASRDLSVSFTGGGATFPRTALLPGAFDTGTGFLAGLISQFTAGAGASRSAIVGQSIFTQGAYGYPITGPAPTDFVYSIGNSTNYSQGNLPSNRFMARTKIEAPTTVFQAPRGMVVGNGDLTSRAENDGSSSFGVNVLWDGLTSTADYGGQSVFTQLLLKQYSDNTFASTSPVNGGPRIFFTAARGNKNQSYLASYPRNNDEMGRLTWWGPTQYLPGTSTVNPPAWISGVAGQDFVDTNSGMGMYFANSPNTLNFNRSLYLASTKGATLIASAADSTNTHQPVIFAPSHLIPTGGNNGNSVFLYNQTVSGTETAIDGFAPSGAHFAQVNYANATALTGSRFTVTNGNNFATEHEGNIALSLDRNSNSANVRVAARTGAINYLGSSNPDRVRFDFAAEGLANATPVTISGFTNATVAGALNGNVFYVKGPFINGSFREYELYTDSGLTTGVNLGVTNVNAGPGTFTYTRTNSVTAKDWSFVLAQGSNNLVLAEDGVTSTTFASGGNINLATNATINYDAVYGCFHNMSNVTAAAADTVYAFEWPNVHINTNRVTVASNSQITIGQEGAYIFALEMQAENTSNQDRNAFIWLAKNGTDIDETCVRVSLLKEDNQVITKEWIVAGINANDYIEVRFAVDNATNVQLTAIPAQASPYLRPAVPSAVITVTPVGV